MNGDDKEAFNQRLEIYFNELIATSQLVDKKGTEMSDFELLLGKGAATAYEAAGYSVRTWRHGSKGVVSYGGEEYLVIRTSVRSWRVIHGDESWRFSSQWELLAWFGGML